MTLPLAAKDHVILLHGLARSHRCMQPLAKDLRKAGYEVTNLNYPSRKASIAELSRDHLAPAIAVAKRHGARRIHFVTHSMGGILLQDYLSRHNLPERGHSVLLAPPAAGCEIVDRLGQTWIFKAINGPAGAELGTDDKTSTPRQLPPLKSLNGARIGVIAGDRSLFPPFSMLLPGKDDGIVSVETTKIPGAEHLVVHSTHTFIMQRRHVRRHILTFLREGEF